MATEYAIKVYERFSLESEKYTVFGLDKEGLQRAINNVLNDDYNFQVIVFTDKEYDLEDE